MVLHRYNWNLNGLLGAAAAGSGMGQRFLEPGLRYGGSTTSKLDFFSLQIAIVLGLAALPHVMMRLLAPAPDPRAARDRCCGPWAWSASCAWRPACSAWARRRSSAATPSRSIDAKGDAAVLLLAKDIGGAVLTALISCLAFVTLLAVAAGLMLAAASSLAHDLYGEVIRKGKASQTEELTAARLSAVVIGVLGMLLALARWGTNTATLAFLAFAIAASAILPTMIYSLFWRRFNARGALLSLYGGLGHLRAAGHLLARRLLDARLVLPGRGLRLLPAAEPGHRLRTGRLPAGLARHRDEPVARRTRDAGRYEEFEVRSMLGTEPQEEEQQEPVGARQ